MMTTCIFSGIICPKTDTDIEQATLSNQIEQLEKLLHELAHSRYCGYTAIKNALGKHEPEQCSCGVSKRIRDIKDIK